MRCANILQCNFEFVALSEEKKKAVRKCLWALDYKDSLQVHNLGSTPFETDFVCFLDEPVRKHQLPRPTHWRWNQCNKQTTISLGDYTLSFVKYNTRQTTTTRTQGHARRKLWLFEIKQQGGKFYFLWCERGEQSSPETTPPESPASSPISPTARSPFSWEPQESTEGPCEFPALSDLSWLGGFMDPKVALEFGWSC